MSAVRNPEDAGYRPIEVSKSSGCPGVTIYLRMGFLYESRLCTVGTNRNYNEELARKSYHET